MDYLNQEDRQSLKNKKFSSTNKIWNDYKLNSRKSVGCTNELIKQFYSGRTPETCDQLTVEDWQDYYFTNGRTLEEIKLVANKLKEACLKNNIKLSDDESISYVLIHVIDEVFLGFERERLALKEISDNYKGFTTKFSDGEEDCDYAVDIIIYDDNKSIIDAFQVKPSSFLYGISAGKDYCIKAFFENVAKHKDFESKFGVQPTFWIDRDYYIYKDNSLVMVS